MTAKHKKHLPKVPNILVKELNKALEQACSELGADQVDEHLKQRTQLLPLQKYIFEHGISGKLRIDSIGQLERAISKIQKYKDGGAAEYLSSAIESELATIRSKEPRRKRGDFGDKLIDVAERNKRIVAYAAKANYASATLGEKGEIVTRIENTLANNNESISKSQLYRVLKEAGLTGKK